MHGHDSMAVALACRRHHGAAPTEASLLQAILKSAAAGYRPGHFGIDQGPIVLTIANYQSGLLWNVMRRCPYVVAGLRRAGFSNGWL
jgi:hypothetical protein